MITCPIRRAVALLRTLAPALLFLAGCSGTAPAPQETPAATPPSPAGPAFALLYFDDAGLHRLDTRTDATTTLAPADTYLGTRASTLDGTRLAFAYTDGEASKLAVYDHATGRITPIHSTPGQADYSLAWSPDGKQLAFGFRADGGAGGVLIADADGATQRPSCTASTQVAHWLPGGDLAVGDGDNLYVVAADDCRTLATTDVRKMHHLTFSPDGRHRAYIYRDLVYNSRARQYQPDSTLYLADARGENPKQVYGNERSVRNLAWSPGGTELAVEVASDDDPGRRQVLLYDAASGTASYLVEPGAGGSVTHPVWSPSGTNVAFDWATEGGLLKAARAFRNTAILGEHHGPTWGWAGDEAVVLPGADGALRVVGLGGETLLSLPPGRTLLDIRPLPAL